MSERLTGQFEVYNDKNESQTLYEYTEYIDVSSKTNPHREIEGQKSIRTSDGQHFNPQAGGRYVIVDTGEVLYAQAR
jgi:hypothetical protein